MNLLATDLFPHGEMSWPLVFVWGMVDVALMLGLMEAIYLVRPSRRQTILVTLILLAAAPVLFALIGAGLSEVKGAPAPLVLRPPVQHLEPGTWRLVYAGMLGEMELGHDGSYTWIAGAGYYHGMYRYNRKTRTLIVEERCEDTVLCWSVVLNPQLQGQATTGSGSVLYVSITRGTPRQAERGNP